MTHDEILSRLDGVKRQATGHVARCPAHHDKRASLGVHVGDDGRTLLRCYAGCSNEDIVKKMGLDMKDLFEKNGREPAFTDPEAIYVYEDADRELVMQVLRLPGKNFRQRQWLPDHPDAKDGWVWTLGREAKPEKGLSAVPYVDRVPYHLPDILEAVEAGETVYIVEGEKDADRIMAEGRAATCNPGGAGSWDSSWAREYFVGAKVIIVTDLDDAGKAHARKVRDSLVDVATVYVVRPKTGKDAYDHLRAGNALNELVPFELDEVTDGLVLVRGDTVEMREREWIEGYKGFFPFGGISMLFGHPGVNKSTLTAVLAAKVTHAGHGAIILSSEGGDQEMYPRLVVAGADMAKCHFLEKREGGTDSVVTLPHDVAQIDVLMEKHAVRLVIIDPLDGALGLDVDSYKSQEVRFALGPLHAVARKHNAAIVLVSHLNQDKSINPLRRAGGPRFTGLARACALMEIDKDDEDTRHLAWFKGNWTAPPKTITFKVEEALCPGIEDPTVKLYQFGHSGLKAKHLLMERRED